MIYKSSHKYLPSINMHLHEASFGVYHLPSSKPQGIKNVLISADVIRFEHVLNQNKTTCLDLRSISTRFKSETEMVYNTKTFVCIIPKHLFLVCR